MRSAIREWSYELGGFRLDGAKGLVRRSGNLATSTGDVIPLEVELDVASRRAYVDAVIGVLPQHATAIFAKAPWIVRNARMRMPKPLAISGDVRVDSLTLDVESAEALLPKVAASALGKLDSFELVIATQHLTLTIVAPQSIGEWRAMGRAIIEVSEALSRRWPSSYRS